MTQSTCRKSAYDTVHMSQVSLWHSPRVESQLMTQSTCRESAYDTVHVSQVSLWHSPRVESQLMTQSTCRNSAYDTVHVLRVSLWHSPCVVSQLMHHPTDRITHTTAFITSHGALAGTRNSSMGPPHEGSIRRPIAPWANVPTTKKLARCHIPASIMVSQCSTTGVTKSVVRAILSVGWCI